jgi:hypothetical protein
VRVLSLHPCSQLEASARATAASALGAVPTPVAAARSSARVKDCPICFEEFSVIDMSCLVPCGHGPLCGGCTDAIAQRSNDCPICKTKVGGENFTAVCRVGRGEYKPCTDLGMDISWQWQSHLSVLCPPLLCAADHWACACELQDVQLLV